MTQAMIRRHGADRGVEANKGESLPESFRQALAGKGQAWKPSITT